MSCEHTTFSLVFVEIIKGKRLRSQTMEVVANVLTILRNSADVNKTQGSLKPGISAFLLCHTSCAINYKSNSECTRGVLPVK